MRKFRRGLAIASVFVASLVAVPGAGALSYGLNADTPQFEVPSSALVAGVATDVTGETIYVAEFFNGAGGATVHRFDTSGTPLSPATMGSGNFSGVAVEQGGDDTVYGFDSKVGGFLGTPKMLAFDSAGAELGSPFPLEVAVSGFTQIASDAAGNIYFPNQTTGVVQKFTSAALAGTPATFECAGTDCNSTPLSAPNGVAVDSSGNVYVADTANNRVVKFNSAGAFQSVFRTGASNSVAVNTTTGDVFVGGDDGAGFHVTIYDSAGTEIGDFGLGIIGAGAAHSQVAVNPVSGDAYVSESNSGEEPGKVWIFSPVAEPTATTGTAAGITQTTAILKGTVNPEGAETTNCHLEWGPAEGEYTTGSAPCIPNPEAAETDTEVSASATGLVANTTYHFQVVETTAGGTVEGGDASFKTLVNKPAISAEAASGISQHAATLAGKVNPNGAATTCEFEYGTSASYGTKVPCSANPGSGEAAVEVSIPALSGLAAGTTYHYRIDATNTGGTTQGTDHTFATLADTCATNAALCPPPPPVITPPATTPPVTTQPPAKKPLKCKKGFKKKTVKGKAKCVKVKKKHKKH